MTAGIVSCSTLPCQDIRVTVAIQFNPASPLTLKSVTLKLAIIAEYPKHSMHMYLKKKKYSVTK